jgi:hypothetical protein
MNALQENVLFSGNIEMENNYYIKRYTKDDFSVWNNFINQAKNATFLFHRNYMEYHHNRFEDFSLMVYNENQLICVIPANRVEDKLFSHQGLTYGGFVFNDEIKLGEVLNVVKIALKFLENEGVSTFLIKEVPFFYQSYLSEEFRYAMFLCHAKFYRRDCLSVIDLNKPYKISKTRLESVRRGAKNKLEIREELNFELFWNEILIPNLANKHQSNPVHTVEEINFLQANFPKNIRHFNVYFNNEIVAGTTIYETETVAHPQYISGNERKNELGSIDFLYHYLLTIVFKDKNYFDFGPSHENNGKNINKGILFWKESYGAKTTMQDWYVVQTSEYRNLEKVLI